MKYRQGVRQSFAFQATEVAFVAVAEAFTPTAARPAAEAAGYHYEARLRGLHRRKKLTDTPYKFRA